MMRPHTFHRHPELVSGSISPLARSKWRQTQPHRKVAPLRVLAINQIDFPLPVPALELLFSRDCGDYIAINFKVNQPVDGIAVGETRRLAIVVLPHPRKQIGRHADIQRPKMSRGQKLNARDALLSHGPACAAKWTLKQVQGDENGLDSVCSLTFAFKRNSTYTQFRHAELVSASIVPQAPNL